MQRPARTAPPVAADESIAKRLKCRWPRTSREGSQCECNNTTTTVYAWQTRSRSESATPTEPLPRPFYLHSQDAPSLDLRALSPPLQEGERDGERGSPGAFPSYRESTAKGASPARG